MLNMRVLADVLTVQPVPSRVKMVHQNVLDALWVRTSQPRNLVVLEHPPAYHAQLVFHVLALPTQSLVKPESSA